MLPDGEKDGGKEAARERGVNNRSSRKQEGERLRCTRDVAKDGR